jgi:hypothetical protein
MTKGVAMKALKTVGAIVILAWMAFVAQQSRLAQHYAEIACANTLDIKRQIDIVGQAGMPDLLGKFDKDVIHTCR